MKADQVLALFLQHLAVQKLAYRISQKYYHAIVFSV